MKNDRTERYLQLIVEYEKSRKKVQLLSKQWSILLRKCENKRELCLVIAEHDRQELCRENGIYYAYDEVLSEGGGRYCRFCIAAFRLKHGPLADARMVLGINKRKLSAAGKWLARYREK